MLKVTLNIGETKESLDHASKFFNILLSTVVDTMAAAKLPESALGFAKKNREADEKKKVKE